MNVKYWLPDVLRSVPVPKDPGLLVESYHSCHVPPTPYSTYPVSKVPVFPLRRSHTRASRPLLSLSLVFLPDSYIYLACTLLYPSGPHPKAHCTAPLSIPPVFYATLRLTHDRTYGTAADHGS